MKLNAQRKASLAVLAVAGCALLADRFVLGGGSLGPQSAHASQTDLPAREAPPATPAPASTPARTLASRLAGLDVAPGEDPALFSTPAARLDALAGIPASRQCLFSSPAPWLRTPEPQRSEKPAVRKDDVATLEKILASHRISGVVYDPAGRNSVVFIDGTPRPAGYTFDGVRIIKIDQKGVTFRSSTETLTRNFATPEKQPPQDVQPAQTDVSGDSGHSPV